MMIFNSAYVRFAVLCVGTALCVNLDAAIHKAQAQSAPVSAPVAVAATPQTGDVASQDTPMVAPVVGTPPQPSSAALTPASGEQNPGIPNLAQEIKAVVGKENDVTGGKEQVDSLVPENIPGLELPVEQEKTAEELQNEMRRDAFETMMNGMLPMKPPELRDAFERMDKNQKAIEEPLAYPKPEVSFTTISLDPGATPLTFKLATGHVTTVSFLDVTGQPWPIKDMTWAGNFEIKSAAQDTNAKFPMYPNLLQIIPMSEYAYGNLSIRLVGLSTPVTFTLRTNREVVQYRLDLRVPEKGPLALPSIIGKEENGLVAGDRTLTRIMEGVPPATAQKLTVDGGDGRTTAYRLDGVTYLRTPLTLLSPAWNASVKSADGMNVYALGEAPVLILSDQGQMVRASLSETTARDTQGGGQ